jgi:hypothetical protein
VLLLLLPPLAAAALVPPAILLPTLLELRLSAARQACTLLVVTQGCSLCTPLPREPSQLSAKLLLSAMRRTNGFRNLSCEASRYLSSLSQSKYSSLSSRRQCTAARSRLSTALPCAAVLVAAAAAPAAVAAPAILLCCKQASAAARRPGCCRSSANTRLHGSAAAAVVLLPAAAAALLL